MKAVYSGISKFVLTSFHVQVFFKISTQKSPLLTKSDFESVVVHGSNSRSTLIYFINILCWVFLLSIFQFLFVAPFTQSSLILLLWLLRPLSSTSLSLQISKCCMLNTAVVERWCCRSILSCINLECTGVSVQLCPTCHTSAAHNCYSMKNSSSVLEVHRCNGYRAVLSFHDHDIGSHIDFWPFNVYAA